jgi:hypothetical protein
MAVDMSRSRIVLIADTSGFHCQDLLVTQGPVICDAEFNQH